MNRSTHLGPTSNPWKLGGLSWSGLAKRTWHETMEDDLLGRAAQLAFYVLLALFPALLFLTAMLGLFPLRPIIPELLSRMRYVLPADALSLLGKYLEQVVAGSGSGILSLGLLGALWASSSGLTALMETLNVAYDVEETRPFWKVRLIAIAMTVGLAGFIILSTILVLSGERIGQWVADWAGLGQAFASAWAMFQWPVALGLMLVAISIIYYVAPNVRQDWRWVTPGSVFAVALWLAVSLGFKAYVEHFGDYNAAYGSLAGIIVLMLWLYWGGVALLIGAEMNSEIVAAATERQEALAPSDSSAAVFNRSGHARAPQQSSESGTQ